MIWIQGGKKMKTLQDAPNQTRTDFQTTIEKVSRNSLDRSKKARLVGVILISLVSAGCSPIESAVQDHDEVRAVLQEKVEADISEHEIATKYAILINGDTSKLHKENIGRARDSLRGLGFKEEDIYILSTHHARPRAESKSLVNAESSRENVELVMKHLHLKANEDDTVVIYATGHGSRFLDESFLDLSDSFLSSEEYKDLLAGIKANNIVSVMDQCYSGGFTDALCGESKNITYLCNTDSTHTTYCKYFSKEFWRSLSNPERDIDGDGKISVREAHYWAMEKHKAYLADREEETNGHYYCSTDEEVFLD